MYHIAVQRALPKKIFTPSDFLLKKWVKFSLKNTVKNPEITIRIVAIAEITQLNHQYRHKKKPTNVLAFPLDMPDENEPGWNLLGDIVVCAEVIKITTNGYNKLAGNAAKN